MSRLHIYAAKPQPLTRYFDQNAPRRGGSGRWFKVNPRAVYPCHSCLKRRQARNLTIQVYYDAVRIRCADGCNGRLK